MTMTLSIITPDYDSAEWEALTPDQRVDVRTWIEAFQQRPEKGVTKWLRQVAVDLGSTYKTARRKLDVLTHSGGDWKVLIDRRRVPGDVVRLDGTNSPLFRAHLVKTVEKFKRNNLAAFRDLKRRWASRQELIPGYEEWPSWPALPKGWGKRNLARIVDEETNLERLRSIRAGTSSKTNQYLPTVLTTRVGLWPGAIIQMDDQWHDNVCTLGRRREPVRVIELGALDVLSGHRFHWGAKPRRRTDAGGYETLRKRDAIMFLAGMLHRTGYSPQGTKCMVEHQTMAVDESMEKIIYDATRGMIRFERQPIEGKQAALSGFWNGTEGGNFRAKAHLESLHNLIRNDMAALPMQTGSFTSGIQGPVYTDRQLAYINKVIKDVLAKCPQRLEMLKLPTLDFHTQLIPWLTDYYQFGLATRTDHNYDNYGLPGRIIIDLGRGVIPENDKDLATANENHE